MKLPKNLGIVLTAIWLILTGIIGLGILRFGAPDTIAALLAIAAGGLIGRGAVLQDQPGLAPWAVGRERPLARIGPAGLSADPSTGCEGR